MQGHMGHRGNEDVKVQDQFNFSSDLFIINILNYLFCLLIEILLVFCVFVCLFVLLSNLCKLFICLFLFYVSSSACMTQILTNICPNNFFFMAQNT